MKKRIGLFGGTFDPIHIGHLILAEQAYTSLSLDEIWFIPVGRPPHKQNLTLTLAAHRAQMVQSAIEDHPAFYLSTYEIEQPGLSYTVNTLQSFTDSCPFYQFFLIMGADMVKDLIHWYKIKRIVQLAKIIALGRIGIDDEGIDDDLLEHVIWIQEAIKTNISSSLIRKRLAQGLSIRYMVPDSVSRYLKEHHLYGT